MQDVGNGFYERAAFQTSRLLESNNCFLLMKSIIHNRFDSIKSKARASDNYLKTIYHLDFAATSTNRNFENKCFN